MRPFWPPDPLHSFGVHLPAGLSQEIGDAPVAVATEATGQSDDGRGERVLIGPHLWLVTLAGAMLTENLAGSAFGYMQPLTDCLDASSAS